MQRIYKTGHIYPLQPPPALRLLSQTAVIKSHVLLPAYISFISALRVFEYIWR